MTWLLLTIGAFDVALGHIILNEGFRTPNGSARAGLVITGAVFLINAAIPLSAVLSRLIF